MSKNFFKNKSIIIFFSVVISFNLLGFFTFLLLPSIAQAQTEGSETYCRDLSKEYVPMGVYIPGVTIKTKDGKGNSIYAVRNLACYLYGFYKYFAGVVGILAAVMIIYGGFKWLTSFGNPSRITAAKDQISSAVIGLLITLCTYIFLYTINPSIVNMKTLVVNTISPLQQRLTMWCEAADKPQQGQSYNCGAKGASPDGQLCIFSNCLSDPNDPKTRIGGQICSEGTKDDAFTTGYVCLTAEKRCERIDDGDPGIGFGRHDELCTPYSIEGAGKCNWYDYIYWWPPNDRCNWRPRILCPEGYRRTSCSKCQAHDWVGNSCNWIFNAQMKCVDNVDIYKGDITDEETPTGSFLAWLGIFQKYKWATMCCEADEVHDPVQNSDYKCSNSNTIDELKNLAK